MANIPKLPTSQQVSTVTGPYVDSLQLYETVLAGTTAPAAAAKADPGAQGQLRTDIATFGAAQSVKSNDSDHFLNSFDLRVIVLQSDMTKLQQSLHPAAAHQRRTPALTDAPASPEPAALSERLNLRVRRSLHTGTSPCPIRPPR